MLYDFIRESMMLEEEKLNEDKVVKFGGEVYPKFGWCLIMMGGSAAGKGTILDKLVPFQGSYYNPDSLKEVERMWGIKNTEHKQDLNDPESIPTGREYQDDFETPGDKIQDTDKNGNLIFKDNENNFVYLNDAGRYFYKDNRKKITYTGDINDLEPVMVYKYRTLKNPKFASELHNKFDDLSKAWKKDMMHRGRNSAADPSRLPNLIFDITGKKEKSVTEIIDTVKPQGYKVAIVMVLTSAKRAIRNNAKRPRSIGNDILIPAHVGAMKTMQSLLHSGYMDDIDDFWVVDSSTAAKTFNNPKEYHDLQNVYHMNPKEGEMSEEKFKEIINKIDNRVNYNMKVFDDELNKEK